MAALVQSYPVPAGGVTMLQPRNSSAVPLLSAQTSQLGTHCIARVPVYRPNTAPIKPYAFTSTPGLNKIAAADSQAADMPRTAQIYASRSSASWETALNQPVWSPPSVSLDDSCILPQRPVMSISRPHSAYLARTSSPQPASTARNTPDRYRRPNLQVPLMPASQPTTSKSQSHKSALSKPLANVPVARGVVANHTISDAVNTICSDVDSSKAKDVKLSGQSSAQTEYASMPSGSILSLDQPEYSELLVPQLSCAAQDNFFAPAPPPDGEIQDQSPVQTPVQTAIDSAGAARGLKHLRNASADSSASLGSSHSSFSQGPHTVASTPPSVTSSASSVRPISPRAVSNIALRASEVVRRAVKPSPLSRPAMFDGQIEPPSAPLLAAVKLASTANSTATNISVGDSPAMKQLAAIGQATHSKSNSKTARLRRALSFGSAADFRKASAHGVKGERFDHVATPKTPPDSDQDDAEQAAIAQRQEEGGIGNNIYGARVFSASIDNVSISSTASSASIMIRKMGRGVKRGTRSLVGLFRPKSVAGVSTSEVMQSQTSEPAISMINVEAELPAQPEDHGSETLNGPRIGFFPSQELMLEPTEWTPPQTAERSYSPVIDASPFGNLAISDALRAQVLGSVPKGILKHTLSNPSLHPADPVQQFPLSEIPQVCETDLYNSSSATFDSFQDLVWAETTANTPEHNEYVVAAMKMRQDTRSAPVGPPQSPPTPMKRNATFSPRIIFHDTWPSQEYDRRGELATCNRLTPMLAQQIKEELNTFKMEMEVHENSKIYTHFF